MKYIKVIFVALIAFTGIVSCEDDDGIRIQLPNDINFNELELARFSSEIPSAPFTAGENTSVTVTVNVNALGGSSYSGFALSNRNWRSYPWGLSTTELGPPGGLSSVSPAEQQQAIDSTAFSVFTDAPNQTENYLVGHAAADDAFFTLSEPAVVEHVLIANTTYNYLMASHGSVYSDDFDEDTLAYLIDGYPTYNVKIQNEDVEGTYLLPAPSGVEAVSLYSHHILDGLDSAFIKLDIEGSLNGSVTGTVEAFLAATEGADTANPEYDFILNDWVPIDLTSLGEVDQVLFRISSSYVDGTGAMIYSPTFCLDGIRIQR
ncbi:MAG: DUF4465 domain-containing protein [Flavobacteriaceae bacterium]